MKKYNKKVCILGSAPSKAEAPYGDKSHDIWAVSGAVFSESLGAIKYSNTDANQWNTVHRIDVLFEMHKRNVFKNKIEKLSTCGIPVIMQHIEDDIPTSEAFPIEIITSLIGEDYTSTIAYMLAYAIYLRYEEIYLYGITLLHDIEYIKQRASIKYYMGIAHAYGIKVWAPDNIYLTKTIWRYGYDDYDYLCRKILEKKLSLDEDIAKQEHVVTASQATLWQLKGASLICSRLISEINGGTTIEN